MPEIIVMSTVNVVELGAPCCGLGLVLRVVLPAVAVGRLRVFHLPFLSSVFEFLEARIKFVFFWFWMHQQPTQDSELANSTSNTGSESRVLKQIVSFLILLENEVDKEEVDDLN